MTVTKAEHTFAGWYRERELIDPSDPSKGYTYYGKWDFENDKIKIDPGKSYDPDESVLTLYAAWIPYCTFEIYAEDGVTLLSTVSAISLTIPVTENGEDIAYGSFPEREGYTLKGVYYLDSGIKLEGGTSIESEVDPETATLKTPVIKLYTEWEQNEVTDIDDLSDNTVIAQSPKADDDGTEPVVTGAAG